MPVTITSPAAASTSTTPTSAPPSAPVPASPPPTKAKRTNGHQKALPVDPAMLANPLIRLRTGHVMTLLSLSASALNERIKAGHFPPPDGFDGPPRVWTAGQAARGRPFWKAATVCEFLAE